MILIRTELKTKLILLVHTLQNARVFRIHNRLLHIGSVFDHTERPKKAVYYEKLKNTE